MKLILLFLSFCLGLQTFSQTENKDTSYKSDTLKSFIQTKLKVQFGTIVKLEVQIFDGDLLQTKEQQGVYLLRIISINDVIQNDTLLISFVDETETFANDNFQLYKLLYKKRIGTISQKEISKMKKIYVNRKYSIMAYETGQFTGIPKGYYNYQPVRADLNFHFKNYLIIVSNLTK